MLTDGAGRGDAAAAVEREGAVGVVSTVLSGVRVAGPGPERRPTPLRPVPVARPDASPWFVGYRRALVVIDVACAALAAAIALIGRFGTSSQEVGTSTLVAAAALPAAWVGLLWATRSYEERFLGIGTDEYERVFRAFLFLTALISTGSYATDSQVARGFVGLALPCALLLDLAGRRAARRRLHAARLIGEAMCPTVAVGDAEAVAAFADRVGRDPRSGLLVVGACVPRPDRHDPARDLLADADIPIVGTPETVREAVLRTGADTVAVLHGVRPDQLRRIGRQLEGTDADLVVSPGLTDVAGTRLHVRPVAELALLHIEQPEFTGSRRVLKGAFDRVVAAGALLLLSPVLLVTVLAVACSSRGPVLFRQDRVGLRGRTFTMYKFRSMYVGAQNRQDELAGCNDHDRGPLFKMRRDPRVTRVGRTLRKYSLDELPQLLNVLKGDMSLVGPRPPLPAEVARYDGDVHRRLLVKPGITGLWQVSGRSDLTWEESVRLDLRYVENWSLALDLSLLCRTAVAVVRATGAY